MSLPAPPRRYDARYHEEVVLGDGTRVALRLVRPGDEQLILDGFAQLSEESRYRRFLGIKASLTAADLRYLTDCDGVDHLAIGATTNGHDGHPTGAGIARVIRLPDRRDTAEAAITVVDALQNRGLGKLLGERLIEAAREMGIDHFRIMILAGNEQARALIDEAAPLSLLKPAVEASEGSLTFEIELPEPAPPPAEPRWREAWRGLLAIAAKAYDITRSG